MDFDFTDLREFTLITPLQNQVIQMPHTCSSMISHPSLSATH